MFSETKPSKVKSPKTLIFNNLLALDLGLENLSNDQHKTSEILSGNTIPIGANPIAQAYAGHQFGHFNILGDGRAILLGEHLTPTGNRFDIQLKGSGITPYSRRGDGRATTSAMLREYLISEAMFQLGIPTTRSLAVVSSGEKVYREEIQDGAVLTRIADSHIRVGTFEFAKHTLSKTELKEFTNYTIQRHFSEILDDKNPVLSLFKKVTELQVDLIVNWMRVGFIHGVMNTDNMSICGETIDYGPCAFMNIYRPNSVFSSIDTQGRYAFDNQASIAQWNLTRFAECLIPLIADKPDDAIELLKAELEKFALLFPEKWLNMMRKKIGILNPHPDDAILISRLLEWMLINEADYTNTFIQLSESDFSGEAIYQQNDFILWISDWQKTIGYKSKLPLENKTLMQHTNPAFIPRNHLVEKALKSGRENSLDDFNELLAILSKPYNYSTINLNFQTPPLDNDVHYKTYCGT